MSENNNILTLYMPGEAAEFSELTIMLIYGESGQGKTTFTKYISHNKGYFISMDDQSVKTFNTHMNITENLMVKDVKIYLQINVLINKLSDNTIIINNIIENTINEISRLQEEDKDVKLIILEGYALSKENIREILIKSIKDKNIRYWICHK